MYPPAWLIISSTLKLQETVFKINVACISEEEVFSIIDYIGIEPGITDNFLYYGLMSKDTEEEHYTLHDQLNETLSLLYDKTDILVSLKNSFIIGILFL